MALKLLFTSVKPPLVVGIDPSTFTGIVAVQGDAVLAHKCINRPDLKGIARVYGIAHDVSSFLGSLQGDPVCFLEHYPLQNKFQLATLVEIGSAIRLVLHTRGIPWYTVPPTTLKKWFTADGKADKEQMAAVASSAKWQFTPPKLPGVKTDDVVDAFALARMGQAFLRKEPGLVADPPEHLPKVPFRFTYLGSATKN